MVDKKSKNRSKAEEELKQEEIYMGKIVQGIF